jgi:tRNA(adenine34) deaminase
MTGQDLEFMRAALGEAARAAEAGEVPVGAVAVFEDRIVATGRNEREGARDPTAHAEMLALRRAAEALQRWRLTGVTLYVTLEPCAMCAGALVNARVDRLVYGCDDPKAGAAGSLFDIPVDPRLNHRVAVERGALADECAALLKDFFAERRE